MVIVSSISPKHNNAPSQHSAIESWNKIVGEENCYSLNSKEEIEILEPLYKGIWWVETNSNIKHLVGKSLVSIWSMIEFAKEKEDDLLIINSDIILDSLPELKQGGITLFSRYDYHSKFEEAVVFKNGFDCFYIPKGFLHLFPFSIYAMGACYHDYVLALICIENKIPVYYPQGIYCYHKIHEVHYSFQEYLDMGEYFRWHFKLSKHLTIPKVATQSLQKIKDNLIYY